MELAVMHGVARVQVKDYSKNRDRDLRARRPAVSRVPSDGAWARQLAADFQQSDRLASVIGGPSPDGPMSGPH